jgi:hypothetical protein
MEGDDGPICPRGLLGQPRRLCQLTWVDSQPTPPGVTFCFSFSSYRACCSVAHQLKCMTVGVSEHRQYDSTCNWNTTHTKHKCARMPTCIPQKIMRMEQSAFSMMDTALYEKLSRLANAQ